jgi:surface antigen
MKIAGYRFIALLVMATLVATAADSGSALADPPPWAPAHGYRAKHKHKHKHKHRHRHEYEHHHHHHYHYDRDRYPNHDRLPFGIDLGLCNRALLGSVLGGAAGGVVGSQIGKGSGRTAATIGGTIIGVLIGGGIGRSMDRVDYGCLGQTLEHAPDSRPVIWRNPGGVQYQVVPHGTYENRFGRYCREYTTTATIGGRTEQIYGTACRQPDGAWELVS